MTSIHGFMDGSFDYRHLRPDFGDPVIPGNPVVPNTLMDYIVTHQDTFSVFLQWLTMSKFLIPIFNDVQGDFTVMLPMEAQPAKDQYEAMTNIRKHMFRRTYPVEFLASSTGMVIESRKVGDTVFVQRRPCGNVFFNGSPMIGYHQVGGASVVILKHAI